MIWFAQWEGKSEPSSSLREAMKKWGLSNCRGRRVEDGVYMINSYGKDVYFIRCDKINTWSRYLRQG